MALRDASSTSFWELDLLLKMSGSEPACLARDHLPNWTWIRENSVARTSLLRSVGLGFLPAPQRNAFVCCWISCRCAIGDCL